jgi:CheY-like chemotaxis protein
MPGMDGYEVARRIRANPANRDISLIACIRDGGQEEDRRPLGRRGLNHHLDKPADIEQTPSTTHGRVMLCAHL